MSNWKVNGQTFKSNSINKNKTKSQNKKLFS